MILYVPTAREFHVAGLGLPRVYDVINLDPHLMNYGCPCVIASKWDYNLELGCILFDRFYSHLANREVGEDKLESCAKSTIVKTATSTFFLLSDDMGRGALEQLRKQCRLR